MAERYYRVEVLDHYREPRNWGVLDPCDYAFHDANLLCGDELTLTLRLNPRGDRIAAVGFEGEGCAISRAAASMAFDAVRGMRVVDLGRLDSAFVLDLLGMELSASRMKCALLCLKVLKGLSLGTIVQWEPAAGMLDPRIEI